MVLIGFPGGEGLQQVTSVVAIFDGPECLLDRGGGKFPKFLGFSQFGRLLGFCRHVDTDFGIRIADSSIAP